MNKVTPEFDTSAHSSWGRSVRTEDPPWYQRQRAAAGALLCRGGRCSPCGRWRLFGGCRGTSGADTGVEKRKDTHSQPTKTTYITTVLITPQHLKTYVVKNFRENPDQVSDIRWG